MYGFGRGVKVLAWAARNERVVLTHDLATMVPALRLQDQRASTVIVLVPDSLPIGQVIEPTRDCAAAKRQARRRMCPVRRRARLSDPPMCLVFRS